LEVQIPNSTLRQTGSLSSSIFKTFLFQKIDVFYLIYVSAYRAVTVVLVVIITVFIIVFIVIYRRKQKQKAAYQM